MPPKWFAIFSRTLYYTHAQSGLGGYCPLFRLVRRRSYTVCERSVQYLRRRLRENRRVVPSPRYLVTFRRPRVTSPRQDFRHERGQSNRRFFDVRGARFSTTWRALNNKKHVRPFSSRTHNRLGPYSTIIVIGITILPVRTRTVVCNIIIGV